MSYIELRLADYKDSVLVWSWRNDPLSRRMFRTTREIPWEEHAKWFSTVLRTHEKTLMIAEHHGEPVGVVRFDFSDFGSAEISINIHPARRGEGFGQKILSAACEYGFKNLELTRIDAEIKPENVASISIFTKAGFVVQSVDDHVGRYSLIVTQSYDAACPKPK